MALKPSLYPAAIAGVSFWICCTAAFAQSPRESDSHVIGRKIGSLAQADIAGKPFDLAAIEESKSVVVAFLGTECPLAKQYARRLQEMSTAYEGRAVFIGIFSNEQDSAAEIEQYTELLGITFPVLQDSENKIADSFAARRTPEVFLLDRSRTIRYRGRVDDQFGIGYAKKEPSQRNLAVALDQVLNGTEVEVSETDPVGCIIGRVKKTTSVSTATFAAHVAPILNRHCVTCHQAGQIGPMSFTEVDDVLGWAAMIDEVVQSGQMPPWHADPNVGRFSNARRLTEEEKNTIAQWVAAGAPIGQSEAIPKPALRLAGWQLPREPDLVIPVSPKPFDIPADGELDYQHFTSDYVFEKETWVQAVQILPGNHAVVHHILAFVESPGGRHTVGDLEGIDGYLAGYVPGLTIEPFPSGMAKRIPAKSKLVFQVHYTPIGLVQTDQSQIGLVFVEPEAVTREVITTSSIRRNLEIPAGSSDHQVSSFSHRPLEGAKLLGMMPHMHLRGKSFRFDLQSADGTIKPLLNVPRYDFHWQSSYRLAEPIPLAADDRIVCVAQFDNSTANPNNPDPRQVVRWGDQTREEMMIGYFDIAIDRSEAIGPDIDLDRHVHLVHIMDRFDSNRNGVAEQTEVPPRNIDRFHALDVNGDNQVTFAELAAGWEE